MEHINIECNRQTNNLRTLSSHLYAILQIMVAVICRTQKGNRERGREREMKWGFYLFILAHFLIPSHHNQPTTRPLNSHKHDEQRR